MRKALSILRTLLIAALVALGPIPSVPTANAALTTALLDRRSRMAMGTVITIPFSITFPCPDCCPSPCVMVKFGCGDADCHFVNDDSVATLTVNMGTANGSCGSGFSRTFILPCTLDGPFDYAWSATIDGLFVQVSNVECIAGVLTVQNIQIDFIDDGQGSSPCNLTGPCDCATTAPVGMALALSGDGDSATGSGCITNGLTLGNPGDPVIGTASVALSGLNGNPQCCMEGEP